MTLAALDLRLPPQSIEESLIEAMNDPQLSKMLTDPSMISKLGEGLLPLDALKNTGRGKGSAGMPDLGAAMAALQGGGMGGAGGLDLQSLMAAMRGMGGGGGGGDGGLGDLQAMVGQLGGGKSKKKKAGR